MKKFLIGVLVGCLLMMTTPVLADSILQSIDVVLDNVQVQVNGKKLDANTILYNGSTYLPMRKVAEAVGKDVTWNQETMTANIIDIGVDKLNNSIKLYQENGYDFLEKDGELYYSNGYVFNSIKPYENYNWIGDGFGENIKITLTRILEDGTEKILIESVPYVLHEDRVFISKDYYENTILLLIK